MIPFEQASRFIDRTPRLIGVKTNGKPFCIVNAITSPYVKYSINLECLSKEALCQHYCYDQHYLTMGIVTDLCY